MAPKHQVSDHGEVLLASFEAAFQRGETSRAEEFLQQSPCDDVASLLPTFLASEISLRRKRGETPAAADFRARLPDQQALIDNLFAASPEELPQEFKNEPLLSNASSIKLSAMATETWRGTAPAPGRSSRELPQIPGYEVIKPLGQGGMGFVVLARDLTLNRLVALKLPLPEKLRDQDDRERFLREARSAARLRHPGICPIYEIGEAAGQPYLALAFIEGQSMTDWAAEHPPSARQSAELVAAIAEAVQAAHEHGVVHRDLKPANVMIEGASGAPILMDFGLAKEQGGPDVHLTVDGAILGTPAYMSPEQAAGNVEAIDVKSDVYGLGGILYWLLGRRAPFTGKFSEVIRLVQTAEPTPLRQLHPGLHRDLETIGRKAMAKDPRDRYATAQELADDLRRFARGEAILARPEGMLRQMGRFARRRAGFLSAGLVLLVVLSIAVVVAARASHDRQVFLAVQQFDSQLESTEWTRQRYEQMEARLQELTTLDARAADAAAARLRHRFRDYLEASVQNPSSLSPDDLDAIRRDLEFFAARDAAAAQELQTELDKRLRSWKSVFDLEPPFDKLSQYFDPKHLAVNETNLVARAPAPASPETKGSQASLLIPTLVGCGGNVELQAQVSEATLYKALRLGLALNHYKQEGYQFVLVPAPPPKSVARAVESPDQPSEPTPTAEVTLGQALVKGRPLELQIRRNGQIVRRQVVAISVGALNISAQREGSRLTCQIQNLPPLVFDDSFPLGSLEPGVFALLVPEGAEIVHVKASRQTLPSKPSPLERGDFLMANRQYQPAFESYREQEAGAAPSVRQEARTKQGLCVIQLGRPEDGANLLQEVAGEKGERWPIVAGCHLWMLRLQQRRYQDAELIREVLSSRYQFEQLASLLPDEFRTSMVREYLRSVRGTNLATFNEESLAQMERLLEAERLIAGQPSASSQLLLLRGYRTVARHKQALRVAAQVLDSDQERTLAYDDRIWLIEEYCWTLRLENQAQQALEYLNRRLVTRDGGLREEWLPLLVERARVHAVLGQPDLALGDLNELLSRISRGKLLYRHYSAARLLQGFLLADQGDEQAAQEAWQAGLYRAWYPDYEIHWPTSEEALTTNNGKRPPLPAENPHQFSGFEFVQFAMLSSLSGQLTDAEAKRMLGWLMFRSAGDQPATIMSVVSLLQSDFALRTFRGMCQSPRGRQVAREVALQSVGLHEFVQHPVWLMLYEVARQGAFDNTFTAAQDEVVWRAAQVCLAGQLEGKISKLQLLGLTFTWKGQMGSFGWGGIAADLDPTIRGYFAFIFGYRMLQMKQPADAANLFRVAIQDAGSDTQLRKLAEDELGKLTGKTPE